jgi:hypothetical protein
MKTIRELIDEKIEKLRNVDSLSPQDIAQESIELSSLLASVRLGLIDRELAYNEVLKNLTVEHKTVTKAKVFADCTPEYRAKMEAEAYLKSTADLIMTTKRHTALAEQEYRLTPR